MNTKEYLETFRKITGYNDYRIAKEFNINQSNLSKYSRGVASLSEAHAFLFANILNINPAQIIADTKLEHAQRIKSKEKILFWQSQVDKYTKALYGQINIAVGQINPVLADLDYNAYLIVNWAKKAQQSGADLIVFPELAAIGYPPEDLLLRDNFIAQIIEQTEFICRYTPKNIYLLIGTVSVGENKLYNSALLIYNQNIIGRYHKRCLPNYGIFDEKRYFHPGSEPFVFDIKNQKIGVIICEDAWLDKPVKQTIEAGANMIISLNASPFQIGKYQERLKIISQKSLSYQTPFLYTNLTGGQDEVVFDGGSFFVNTQGELESKCAFFEQTLSYIKDKKIIDNNPLEEKLIYDSLVTATKDYIKKNNFSGVILGLSGGIDSALTLAIASDAIGSKNVEAILMPSQYNADISLLDAQTQANKMGIIYTKIAIDSLISAFTKSLSSRFLNTQKDITEENIQARIRGTLLMAISNKSSKMLLTTGNKSEMSIGYATLYGDTNGGFAPLKDIYKTMIYRLAYYRNTLSQIIPIRVIERAPSAELSPHQVDSDTLPDYQILDAILQLFIEKRCAVKEIIDLGYDASIVEKTCAMVLQSEYKRRQLAPGPKISTNAFGKERRYPITSKFSP